jgi:pimeloyl-ACP methyl ester carboxylesterase
VLGLEMVRARPELFSAYVGTAQASAGFGDRRTYDIVLEAARARGDGPAIAALQGVGAPPDATFEQFLVRQQFANVPAPREGAQRAAMATLFAPPPADARYTPHLPPYDFIAVFMATQRTMFAEMQAYDLRRSVGTRFEVPIFMFQGDSDLNTPPSLARAYFDEIEAPRKEFALIPGAGHDTIVFAPELLALLNQHVRPVAIDTR